jgi:hypothetical protein
LLGRREQDVGRIAALALALRRRRVAGTGFEPDAQTHFRHAKGKYFRSITVSSTMGPGVKVDESRVDVAVKR